VELIAPEGVRFLSGRSSHTAPPASVFGVVLGTPPTKTSAAQAVCSLVNGDSLHGALVSADQAGLVLALAGVGNIQVPWKQVASLDCRGARAVWLSDLAPAGHEAQSILSPYFPPTMNRGLIGRPIALRGKTHDHGIGLHAHATLHYSLDARYDRFLAVIGVDDAARGAGSVIFRVRGDDRLLYESNTLRGNDPPATINLDLRGVQRLTLECDDAGDLDVADHGVWADATLLRSTDGVQ
jgi:hypothetical protein